MTISEEAQADLDSQVALRRAGPPNRAAMMAALQSGLNRAGPRKGLRFAAVGDSIITQNHKGDNSSPTMISNETNGEVTWARLSNPSFLFHVVYDDTRGYADGNAFWGLNEGIGGDMTANVKARLNNVIAKRPDVCYVSVGTNDISQVSPAVSFETIIANLADIISRLRKGGAQVILATIRPRSSSSWAIGSTARKKYNRVNSWIRDVARRMEGVYIHDAARALTDPSSTTGQPLTGVLKTDDLHLTPVGARLSGIELGMLLGRLFPAISMEYQGAADDVYDGTDNPLGNLLSNGRFSGVAGTAGAGTSGAVATGWTVARTTGSTVTCVASKETDAVLGDMQVLTFTLPGGGGGVNDVFMMTANTVATGPVAGEYVQGGLSMKIPATPNLVDALLFLRNSVNTSHSCCAFRQDSYSYPLPTALIEGPIITEPFIVPVGTAAWTYRAEIRMPAANIGQVVIKYGNAWLRKIADPSSMWS